MMRKLFVGMALVVACQAQVRYEDILRGPAENWLTYAGDYQGQRHSPLQQITADNAGSLVPQWMYHIPKASGLRTNPIVYNGVMYVTNSNEIRALDARSGSLIWQYKDTRSKKDAVNRGAAILGDRVFFVTADIHLTALDRQTGALLWQKKYGNIEDGLYASAAPLALRDQVLVGVAGGDTGMRGYIASFSPSTGEELWRTYTIPQKGEPGSETWGKLIDYGGGATWLSGTFDPDLNTTLLDHRKSLAGLLRGRPRRRQSLFVFPAGARCQHGQNQMAFSIHTPRHARLGCPIVAGAGGSPLSRHGAQTRTARQSQRFSLRPRPRHRRVLERHAPRRKARLG